MSAESCGGGVVCPTCGRDDFASERGMKVHHYRKHGKCLRGAVVVECAQCGKTFECDSGRVEDADNNFCSEDCYGRWTSRHRTGDDHPNYRGVELECAWCGDIVERSPSEISSSGRVFCDYECIGEWNSANRSGESHSLHIERTEFECEWCGEVFKRLPNSSNYQANRFCSRTCMGDWISENATGEDAPAWKGGWGGQYYGPNWKKKRQEALERDGYECVGCGVSQDEHQSQFGRELHVHHHQRKESFRKENGELDYEAANDLNNLITVCPECHGEAERVAPLNPFVE